MLQQYLPFTVLKLCGCYCIRSTRFNAVATVLTVYGIETYNTRWFNKRLFYCRLQQHLPFTVLKLLRLSIVARNYAWVATALTVYGIET